MTASGKIAGDNRLTARITRGITYLGLGLVAVFTCFPFFWMLLSSFKPLTEIFGQGFWPQNPSLGNYRALLEQTNVLRTLWNSVFVALLASSGSVLFCALGGYGFAKFNFPGKNLLFSLMLATMTIPFVVEMIPTFIMMRNWFGWVDTPWPLIVPGLANAFGIFFMRQYMLAIPDDLLDAARIDGASEPLIFWRIILPISVPAMASLGIIFFMASWNNFLWPAIILRSPEQYTLPVMIASLQGSAGRTPYDLIMAASVISVIPMLLVFLLLQRYFYAGITAGSVKG